MAFDDAFPTAVTQLTTMAQWEAFFTGFSADGVIPGVGLEMAPYFDASTRTAGVAPGAAQIRGFRVEGPTHTSQPIPDAAAQNRIDRFVLRLNRAAATAAEWITPVVLTGTPGSAPIPPALTQSLSGLFDIPMAPVDVWG
ncbi:hypothetical protein ACFHW2_11795 [Actinomadura sp. LOL_016]|uniref:hypothetical protein n=1 Tax=unclassified Actinomadura TaxID=2626254 RepID=UPI003A808D77